MGGEAKHGITIRLFPLVNMMMSIPLTSSPTRTEGWKGLINCNLDLYMYECLRWHTVDSNP